MRLGRWAFQAKGMRAQAGSQQGVEPHLGAVAVVGQNRWAGHMLGLPGQVTGLFRIREMQGLDYMVSET